jgi:hypothetical protein
MYRGKMRTKFFNQHSYLIIVLFLFALSLIFTNFLKDQASVTRQVDDDDDANGNGCVVIKGNTIDLQHGLANLPTFETLRIIAD